MKNINIKKVLVVAIFAIIIIIGVIFAFSHKKNESENGNTESDYSEQAKTLYTHQVIDIENLDTSLYKDIMKTTTNFKIASKYSVGKQATTVDAKVDMYLDGKIARAYFIREDKTKLNIVQLRQEITDDEEMTAQNKVDELIRDFEMECKSNMNLRDLEKEPDEVNIKNDDKPYSEKIFLDKEIYSARYIVKDDHFSEEEIKEMNIDMNEYTSTYDINFYMDGDNTLVCEFVKIL